MFKQKSKTPNTIRRVLLLAILAVVTVASFSVFFGRGNHAAAATSSTINFQARLLTSAGNVVPDGQYNVEFKLYNASTSTGSSQGSCSGDSACVWTETRTTANKVRTVNGYLTVNLGSVTAFGAINWDQDLWLTMNIGGTGVASWDGEMSPRLKLTAVPYAFTAGKLVGGTGANTTTLNTGTPSGTNTISLPAESGTLCIQNSANCGFALSSGSGNYIQNTTSLQNANYYVRAATSGSVAGVLQANASGTGDILDLRNGAGTLVGSFSSTGAFFLQPSADTTSSFNLKTSTGNNMFTIDTQNSRVGIGLGSTNLPSLNAGGLQINGALKLSGGSTQQDLYVTPNGGTVSTMINVVNFDPGAFGQIIAMGLPSTANATSRAISLLDARTVSHQPTIAVFSPNQNNVFGFSWEGSNTDSYVKSSGTGSIFLQPNGTNALGVTSTAVNLNQNTTITGSLTQSGGTFSLTGNSTSSISTTSGTLTLQSVDANNNIVINGGSTSMNLNTGSSGTITVGSSGTTTVYIGANTNNARTVNIGFGSNITSQAQTINLGSATGTGATTIRSGSGNTTLTSTGSTIVKQSGTATTTAFQVQNVAGTQTYFNVDALNGRVGIGNAAPAYTLDVTGDVNISTGSAYKINGVNICTSSGCTASSSSAILNQNASTQAAVFKIQAASDVVTATILANGSQNADVFEIQSSTASPVAGIRPSGAIWSAPIVNPVSDVPASARLFIQASAATSNAAVFRASALGTGVSSDGAILRLQNKDGTSDTFSVGGDGAVTSKTLTNSTAAMSIQNSVGGPALNIDNTNANLISNPNMEAGTTGWAAKGSAALSQQTTFAYDGNNSMRVVTTAAANDGAKFNFSLLASTQYTFSVFVRASADFSTLQIGYSSDGTNDTSCATAQTAKNANWMRLTCTFTTGAVSGTRYVYVKQTDAAIHTFYIDGAQLETAASASLYRDGKIAVGGSLLINGGQAAASASQAALQVNALQGGGGLKVYGSGDNNIFQDAMNVYTADGLTSLFSVSDSVRVTTVQGGNSFFNTPALRVITNDTGASAIDLFGASGQTGDILRLYNNTTSNTKMFSIAAAGAATFQNATDSDSAFMVNESGGNAVLRVDTTNQKVAIGLSSGAIPAKLYVSTGSTVALRAKQTGSSDLFQLANGTADVHTVSSTGATNIKTTTNDTNALRIQNSASASVFSVDTSANQINVGSTSQSAQLNMTGEISWGASLSSPQGFEGATFVPTSPGTWTTGGTANWTRTTANAQSGAASAVSADVGDSQTSWLDLNYTFTVDGTFSFYWKVSSEAGWDYLNFCYDNDGCTRTSGFDQQISGEVGWVKVSKAVTAGAHSFRWLYAKDTGDTQGSDLGWIDNVQFNGGGSAGVLRGGTLSFIASDTISFQTTNNANALTVDSNGRVGMNTSAPTEALTVVGNFNVANSDTPTKQYRFRTSGGSLDFEGAGAALYLSAWSGASFTGTQYTALILYNDQSRMDVKAGYTYFNPTTDSTSTIDVDTPGTGLQNLIRFAQTGTVQGSITVNGATVAYNAFTGSHYAWTDVPIDRGKVVSMTGDNKRRDPNDFTSEPFYGITETAQANDPKVLGAYFGRGAGDWTFDNPDQVMSVGNGDMWVDDEGGDIQPGDYLISSNLKGYAMKDTGQFAESYIIARASDDVNWSNETAVINGHKVKKISVLFTQFSRLNAAGLAMGLTSGGLVSNDVTFNGLAFFNKAVQFKADATFEGLIKVSDNTAGTVKIPAGQTSGTVTFSKPYGKPPKVTTGISEFVDVVVDNKTNNGFTVRIPSPRGSDTFVDWTAFEAP